MSARSSRRGERDGGAFWTTAEVTAGALAALLAVTFLIGTLTGKHSVMDVAWGAGIMVAGVAGFLACPGHGVAARRSPATGS